MSRPPTSSGRAPIAWEALTTHHTPRCRHACAIDAMSTAWPKNENTQLRQTTRVRGDPAVAVADQFDLDALVLQRPPRHDGRREVAIHADDLIARSPRQSLGYDVERVAGAVGEQHIVSACADQPCQRAA